MVFDIQNLNGKTLNFRLVSEAEAPITPVINQNGINTTWYLTLELTLIEVVQWLNVRDHFLGFLVGHPANPKN